MSAESEARELLASGPYSERALRRQLSASGHGDEAVAQALTALVQTGTDYSRECLRSAQETCAGKPWISRRELAETLSEQGFLPDAIAYTEKTLPVNWYNHARAAYEKSAQLGVDPSAAENVLLEAGFRPGEISYALSELPESVEEDALRRARYMLGAAPSSEASIRSELGETFDEWAVQTVIERLGDIWKDQAIAAGWRLLGRYGPLLSQPRLGSYLRMQGFTLIQIAYVLREIPVDWNAQALQCARFYRYQKEVAPERLKAMLRDHQFTVTQVRTALQQISD